MPATDTANPGRDSSAQRGQALVERYARESHEHGAQTSEHVSAAGDLIADVLAYIATLTEDSLPSVYRTGQTRRLAGVAARGVWNALATPNGDPANADIEEAYEAFSDYLRLA